MPKKKKKAAKRAVKKAAKPKRRRRAREQQPVVLRFPHQQTGSPGAHYKQDHGGWDSGPMAFGGDR